MGYELHIERLDPSRPEHRLEISLDEWKKAVEATVGVRLAHAEEQYRNPQTGETVKIPNRDGDVQIETRHGWLSALKWHKGKASFAVLGWKNAESNELWLAVRDIAQKLNAQIVGDDGEQYDLKSMPFMET